MIRSGVLRFPVMSTLPWSHRLLTAGGPLLGRQVTIRWRSDYGRLKLDWVKRLEAENARLRKAVADLALEKVILKEAAAGNWFSIRGAWRNSSFAAPGLSG
jgi:hypothetical protein